MLELFVGAAFIGTIFVGTAFVTFTDPSHVITESPIILLKSLLFALVYAVGFQRQCFSGTYFFVFLHLHRNLLLFHFWFELHFLPSNLHFQSHDICFVDVFD